MTTYVPKNPETIDADNFTEVLNEFNEVFGKEYKFYFNYDYPSNVDVHCTSDTTADGYEIWYIADDGHNPSVCEDVYYYPPHPSDLLDRLEYGIDDAKVYCEIEQYEIAEELLERLRINYDNYLFELEDNK